MIVWMSQDGLSKPVEEDGIIFVEAPGAYGGADYQGGYTIKEVNKLKKQSCFRRDGTSR